MGEFRLVRLGEQIRAEIAGLILSGKIKDPRVSPFLSVTRVDVSSDLAYAKVYVSSFQDAHTAKKGVRGLESAAGKVFSFACGLFVGLFWVVYGQVYQSGAFVYEFCLGWAVSLVPLALVAGNRWLWLLWAAVVNLYILSFLDLLIYVQHAWILFVFNIACFAVSEWAARRSGKGGWFSLFFLAAALSGCFLAAVGRWGVSFWGNLGLILLVGFYAWRFKRGAAQLGFCALALDILLAERIISSLHYGNGIITVTALLLVFVCSAAGVYGLSRPEEANDR